MFIRRKSCKYIITLQILRHFSRLFAYFILDLFFCRSNFSKHKKPSNKPLLLSFYPYAVSWQQLTYVVVFDIAEHLLTKPLLKEVNDFKAAITKLVMNT